MGKAFDMLAKGMREALETFGKFGPHKGLPTLKDVPMIIRAMDVRRDAAVAEEAHAALVWLAGRDLGRDPAAWKGWWAGEAQEMLRREGEEENARRVMLEVKRGVLVGDWRGIHASLCADLRSRYSPGDLSRQTICTSPALRGVYRDTSVRGVRLHGNAGRIDVDWGRLGFEAEAVPVVREGGEWKLACLPWSSKLVKREHVPEAVRPADRPEARKCRRPGGGAAHHRDIVRHRKFRLLGRGPLGDALIVLLCLLPLGLCYFWPLLLLFYLIFALPTVLFWVLLFGRLKSPTEIRRELRQMRGGR